MTIHRDGPSRDGIYGVVLKALWNNDEWQRLLDGRESGNRTMTAARIAAEALTPRDDVPVANRPVSGRANEPRDGGMGDDLREYLIANMFDGSDAGQHTEPTGHLLDRVVENVREWFIERDWFVPGLRRSTHPSCVPSEVHVRGGKALVVMSNGDSFMAPVKDTVECGACGTRIPAIRTKAQQKPDSPEMTARIEHVRNCPGRPVGSAPRVEGGD